MNHSHPFRRIALATIAVAVSGMLLRGQMADALVVRGDEFLYRSYPSAALRYYRRALQFDPSNAVALDRLLFVATLVRDRASMLDAAGRSIRYLEGRADDDVIRLDLAMTRRRLGDEAAAFSDFAVVGYRTRDARALALGAFAAQSAAGDRVARRLFRAALVVNPKMPAALHALSHEGLRP